MYLGMLANMYRRTLLCLVGLQVSQAFQVDGDCNAILEGLSIWQGGASWDVRAATLATSDWSLLFQFDRPLQGLQVYNGVMETGDMKKFKITPEKFLRYHVGPVDVSFLVNYEASLPPANLKSIKVNEKTLDCKEGLGDAKGRAITGRQASAGGQGSSPVPPAAKVPQEATPIENIVFPWFEHSGTTHTATSSVTCTGTLCKKTTVVTFIKDQPEACPPDDNVLCPLYADDCTRTHRAEWMRAHCFTTCFCQ